MMQKNRIIRYENDEIINSFTSEEKDILFEDIMSMYFRKNFGTLSKTDLETYLFSFYIEHLLDTGEPFDDYTLGKDLGITQSRIRSLKERKELKYPREDYDWKESFLSCAQNARYDEVKHLIKFSIPDVNVLKDLRNFVEKNNYYDEYQINPKLFQCRLEFFYEIFAKISEEAGEEFIFDSPGELKKKLESYNVEAESKSAVSKILNNSVEEGIKELLKSASKELLLFVFESLMPGAKFAGIFIEIIKRTLKQ